MALCLSMLGGWLIDAPREDPKVLTGPQVSALALKPASCVKAVQVLCCCAGRGGAEGGWSGPCLLDGMTGRDRGASRLLLYS